jgi:hypothetical protein
MQFILLYKVGYWYADLSLQVTHIQISGTWYTVRHTQLDYEDAFTFRLALEKSLNVRIVPIHRDILLVHLIIVLFLHYFSIYIWCIKDKS